MGKKDRGGNGDGNGDGEDFGGPDEFIDSLYDDLEDTQPVVAGGGGGGGSSGTVRRPMHENQRQQEHRPIPNKDDCGSGSGSSDRLSYNNLSLAKRQKIGDNTHGHSYDEGQRIGTAFTAAGGHPRGNDTFYDDSFQNDHYQRQESKQLLLQQIQDENKCLKRNISILFRTAKNELQRKDDKIQQLQQKLDSFIRKNSTSNSRDCSGGGGGGGANSKTR